MVKSWNRWHTDGWVLTVERDAGGQFTYSGTHGDMALATKVDAKTLADAQHRAEDIVRNSGHRCTGACSYWVSETQDED